MSTLAANAHTKTLGDAKTLPDPTWKGVYQVGGVGMAVAGVCYVVGAVISVILGPPPSGDEAYLQALAGHVVLSQINFGLFALADFGFLPAALALSLALKHLAKNAMLIAVGALGLFIVLDLGITELNSLTLVTLTQQYAAATTAAQRAAYTAAADYALATLPLATFYSFLVSSIGFLIVSLVMLKGVFGKRTAYLGIISTIAGILGAFYVVVPILALLLSPCLIAFGIYLVLGGVRLYTLGKPVP